MRNLKTEVLAAAKPVEKPEIEQWLEKLGMGQDIIKIFNANHITIEQVPKLEGTLG